MDAPLTRPGRWYATLVEWLNGAGVVWVFALMFLICADITGRTVFDHPIVGVTEMVSLSLVGCVFLQLAHAVHNRRLMHVEMVLTPLEASRPRLVGDWHVFLAAVAAVLFALLAIGAWPDFVEAYRTSEFAGVEGIYKITVWPIKLILVVGAALAAIEMLRQLVVALRHDAQPRREAAASVAALDVDDGSAAQSLRAAASIAVPGAAVNPSLEAAAAPSWRRRPRERQSTPPPGASTDIGSSGQRWLAVVAALAFVALGIGLWSADVEPRTIGIVMIAATLVAIALGMPIAVALLAAGFVGLAAIKHDWRIATRTLALAGDGTISDYVFATVPLFVLMGLFVQVSEIGRDAFRAAQKLFGRVYGGLGVATVAANAVFAAITGISIAAAAIFTKIAVPEMVRQGYTPKFAVGLTAGSSLLGMLIPPSLLLIIYGVIAEQSIGALFLAAVIPGILLATAFAVGVILMAWLWPGFVGDVRRGGASDVEQTAAQALVGVLPVVVLIVLVLGGIYGGVFTPTEAGAAGAFAAMLLALVRRRLSFRQLWEVISETGQVSVSILFLIIAASMFSRMLTLTELPQDMAAFLGNTGLGLPGFLAAYLLLLLVLGTLLDSTSIMLIMLPLALPVATALHANLVWFGVVTTIAIEIGLLTPPFGLSVYVIKASMNDPRMSLGTIFGGAFPFVLITLAVTIVLMAFPQLSLWLL